ncbi:MAG: hypothetical protein M1837_005140 [Sclerophora amabilis]|nr:MAG: hypothetical protein M1837_005140 [Sclerophora amabilis]
MPNGFDALNHDVLLDIAERIGFEDVINLARTCKRMYVLVNRESLLRDAVKSEFHHTIEAKHARNEYITYQEAARRIFNRRESVATANPVSVSVIGCGAEFLYNQGILCYRDGDFIRILGVHSSSRYERVINIPTLIEQELSTREDENVSEGIFSLLHYSNEILSGLWRTVHQRFYLVALKVCPRHVRTTCLAYYRLESISKLFVRNDNSTLYFGTYSGTDTEKPRHREWEIRAILLQERRLVPYMVSLRGFWGSEIGVTACFEVYDGFFYAISNQDPFENDTVVWTSYYRCFRLSLDALGSDWPEYHHIWRRDHTKGGPINNSWTDLRFYVDERTGDPSIAESLCEWTSGGGSLRRTFSSQPLLDFPIEGPLPENPFPEDVLSEGSNDSTTSPQVLPTNLAPVIVSPTSQPNGRPQRERQCYYYDIREDPLVWTGSSFMLAKTKLRYYNPHCATFLDLVDHPIRAPDAEKHRLRLRIGSWKLAPPSRNEESGLLEEPTTGPDSTQWICRGLKMWPPDDKESSSFPRNVGSSFLETTAPTERSSLPIMTSAFSSPTLRQTVYSVLNPAPNPSGNVEGVADDRSVVYIPGSTSSSAESGGPIVLVNFDPHIHIGYDGGSKPGTGDGKGKDSSRPRAGELGDQQQGPCDTDAEISSHSDDSADTEDSEVYIALAMEADQDSDEAQPEIVHWSWIEPAAWTKIPRGVRK